MLYDLNTSPDLILMLARRTYPAANFRQAYPVAIEQQFEINLGAAAGSSKYYFFNSIDEVLTAVPASDFLNGYFFGQFGLRFSIPSAPVGTYTFEVLKRICVTNPSTFTNAYIKQYANAPAALVLPTAGVVDINLYQKNWEFMQCLNIDATTGAASSLQIIGTIISQGFKLLQ